MFKEPFLEKIKDKGIKTIASLKLGVICRNFFEGKLGEQYEKNYFIELASSNFNDFTLRM